MSSGAFPRTEERRLRHVEHSSILWQLLAQDYTVRTKRRHVNICFISSVAKYRACGTVLAKWAVGKWKLSGLPQTTIRKISSCKPFCENSK